MITAEMRYGALAAKVRAMYGKRLRFSDFETMAGFHAEGEVLEYLRAQPGWSAAVADLGSGYVGRIELETALKQALWNAYRSLSHFVPKEDKALVASPVRLAELDQILLVLRRLKAGRAGGDLPPLHKLEGKLQNKALCACTDYDGLLAATKGSLYYPSLVHVKPEEPGALPDYATTEALLHAAYYAQTYRLIHRQYAGQTKALLLRAFGEEIDLLNLIHILRLKTYFPGDDRYYSAIFPFYYRLRPEEVKALCNAPDLESCFALLQDTPYAKALVGLSVRELEAKYWQLFYRFNQRQLVAGAPGVYTALAYLNTKELELRVLVNIIESVKYGAAYNADLARIVGA
ncbi:MAG: V-type ATPase subunit [Pseudoflavonifractor sp.]